MKYSLNLKKDEKEQFYIKPTVNPVFGSMLYDMAGGNVNSLFACIDENKSTFIVGCGNAVTEREDCLECEENMITEEIMHDFEIVPAMPFRIEFSHPVSKVFCGDEFSGMLTAQG